MVAYEWSWMLKSTHDCGHMLPWALIRSHGYSWALMSIVSKHEHPWAWCHGTNRTHECRFHEHCDTLNFKFPDFHCSSNWAEYGFFILCFTAFKKSVSTLTFDVFTMVAFMKLANQWRNMFVLHTYSYLLFGRGHCKGIKYKGRYLK